MGKQQVFIIVGADMVGKTQIAKELANRLGIPYFKASSEHHAFMNDPSKFVNDIRYADPRLVDFIKQSGASVVMDRGFPCEFVYAQTLGRTTDLKAIDKINEAYAALNAKVIVCVRKNGFKGIQDDLDPKRLTSEMLQKLQDEYHNYATYYLKCRSMILAVDDENLDREVQEIMEFANR